MKDARDRELTCPVCGEPIEGQDYRVVGWLLPDMGNIYTHPAPCETRRNEIKIPGALIVSLEPLRKGI